MAEELLENVQDMMRKPPSVAERICLIDKIKNITVKIKNNRLVVIGALTLASPLNVSHLPDYPSKIICVIFFANNDYGPGWPPLSAT